MQAYRSNEQSRAVITDASQQLENGGKEADVDHWFRQLQVTKVARTFESIFSASFALV